MPLRHLQTPKDDTGIEATTTCQNIGVGRPHREGDLRGAEAIFVCVSFLVGHKDIDTVIGIYSRQYLAGRVRHACDSSGELDTRLWFQGGSVELENLVALIGSVFFCNVELW